MLLEHSVYPTDIILKVIIIKARQDNLLLIGNGTSTLHKLMETINVYFEH